MPEPAYMEQADTRPVSHVPSDKKYGLTTRHQKLLNKIIKEQEDSRPELLETSETCDCGLTGKHKPSLDEITKSKHKIENGNLNIKYTKTIDRHQYKELGELLSSHCMGLRAACTITDNQLLSFFEGFGKAKTIKELDVSCSENLFVSGFRTLAGLVTLGNLKTLKLGGCRLSKKHVDAIHKELLSSSDQLGNVEELDISYNPELEPDDYEKIGQIVEHCNVKKLRLAGCNLNINHMEKLRCSYCQMVDTIDFGDNTLIGEGIATLANIVKKWEVKELDISGCMFTQDQLKMFRESLKGTEIRELDLSDCDRTPDEAYIEEVCKLLPLITESLILQFKSISASSRRMLQSEINKLKKKTTIILLKETITWERMINDAKVTDLIILDLID